LKKLFIETYGCQMNFSDSEIVASILSKHEYALCSNIKEADVILVNTCSVRDNAEQRVINRMKDLLSLRKKNKNLMLGVIGCMAERLQHELINKYGLNIVAGPDSYRNLPALLSYAQNGNAAIDVELSISEMYDGIEPLRAQSNGVSAFLSIMRGCTNFCTYCVVPYTRGTERSRSAKEIFAELQSLSEKNFKEVTLLGQNVNSYLHNKVSAKIRFPELLSEAAGMFPNIRFRFATSHPKDLSEELIDVIAGFPNVCSSIHLPVQSGSNAVLKKMKRGYSREDYLKKVELIYQKIPDCSLTTDIISGFCGETDTDHADTISLMKTSRFAYAYMFKYSERPGTHAAEHYTDDIPEHIKLQRLTEVIELQQKLSLKSNSKDMGKTFEVLIEGVSKRDQAFLFGRTPQNKVVVFPAENYQKGNTVKVLVNGYTSATLTGNVATSLSKPKM